MQEEKDTRVNILNKLSLIMGVAGVILIGKQGFLGILGVVLFAAAFITIAVRLFKEFKR